jgi:hypothetical protein
MRAFSRLPQGILPVHRENSLMQLCELGDMGVLRLRENIRFADVPTSLRMTIENIRP